MVIKVEISQEKKLLLENAKKKVDMANKCRLAFLFIAAAGLVFVYFGDKIWKGIGWYDSTVTYLYIFLFVDIFLMFIATITKIIFAAKYNKIVKSI